MNAVAFCLYGDNPKYLEGMLQNAWLMPRIYPGWECHVWVDVGTIPKKIVHDLAKLGCQIHVMQLGWRQRMFYRFLIHDVPGVERYLIRDADSRISPRERRCVHEWIRSGKILHTIHDHPYHQRPIQGGMFGIWREKMQWNGIRSMRERIAHWPDSDKWGRDEEFLEAEIWPLVRGTVCEHGRSNPIPAGTDEDAGAFIGEIYLADGTPEHPEHRAMRK